MNKLTKLFWVSRPISWVNTAFPFAAGYLLTVGQVDLLFILGTIYFLWPYNLFLYGINDVFDYESDILNPRKGGVEGMKESRAFHPTIIWATAVMNIPFVVYLFSIGDMVTKLVFAFVLFAVAAYSVAGLRFKEKPVLDSITSSLHFVGPLLFAFSITGFKLDYLPFIIAFFLWGMASHAFGAVQDILPDRKAGLASIATVFGAKWTVRLAALMYQVAAVLMFIWGGEVSLLGLIGIIYVFNVIKYINVSDKKSDITNIAWKRFIWLNYISGFAVTITMILINL